MKFFISFLLALSIPASAFACNPNIEISNTLEVISIYPSPAEGEYEWVQIQNTGSQTLDLSLYTLADNTENPWTMSGNISAGESLEISGFSFQLNNGGDTVTLSDINGTIIDIFEYSNSSAGEAINSTTTDEVTEDTIEETASSTPTLWPDFSEALPNPEGSDSTEEWIELYNPHQETIQLNGLYIDDQDGGSSPYALEGSIAPESFFLISIEDSKITLNNSTDHVRLLGSDDEILWDIAYDAAKEGESYALLGEYYDWTNQVTPNASNIATTTEGEESEFIDGDLSEDISITEILPNPEGPDATGEWIEITNGGEVPINLGNWTLDDGPGGSDPYTFPDDIIIEPGETLLIDRETSDIALNNSDEVVELTDFTGEIIDEVSYEQSTEGESFAEILIEEVESLQASLNPLGKKTFSTWKWVSPTPGELNPRWMQVIGEVSAFENQSLDIYDGLSTWTFQVQSDNLNSLLFQTGNRVLVQASSLGDNYLLMNSELLQSVEPVTKKKIPWSFILSFTAILAWISYELIKKKSSLNHFPPSSEMSTL